MLSFRVTLAAMFAECVARKASRVAGHNTSLSNFVLVPCEDVFTSICFL